MTRVGWFVVGALVGAGAVALAPVVLSHPSTELQDAKADAAAARDVATARALEAKVVRDSLDRMRRRVDALLQRPPRVVPGPSSNTLVIAPTDSGDTTRTVVVPPEVVAELAATQQQVRSLVEERDVAFVAIAKLDAAAQADAVADSLADHAHAVEVADLQRQVRDARRSARVWKVAGVAVVVVVVGRAVGDALK